LPYCDFHARRAFQPPQPRRRDREVFVPGVTGIPAPAQVAAPVEPASAVTEPEEKAAV
jgi:GcrA cell cycle regulator